MERKKFFNAIGMSLIGILFVKLFPFRLFSKQNVNKRKIKVHINPFAVKRKKIGGKNV